MDLEEIAKLEMISLRPKSRCLWLEHRDKNTKFFHKLTNTHKSSDHIEKVESYGIVLEEERINSEILTFYESPL